MGLTVRELYPSEHHERGQGDLPQWFALTVKYQHEGPVHRVLCSRGIETFLPLFRARRRWSDRVKELEAPLFPGYVFGRFPFRERVRVLNTPGVARIVGFAGRPAPVREQEIENIRISLRSKLPLGPWPFMKPGDRVCVAHGPLRGVEGRLVREKSCARFIVDIELLQRSVAIEIDSDMLAQA